MTVDVEPTEAEELIRNGGAQLVDVREDHEVEAARLPGARHIALGRLSGEAQSLDRDRPVLFYCAVGSRSHMAATAFRDAGYEAYSLAGGIVAWHEQGRPIEPEDGHVAGH